ncbi:MAG: hypothetical protein DHS20C04_24030 [Hyphococcus sp.]|nr:MAG: hypothetical protein DHS20C04_24030 [Marinicaulis sp.]
MRIARSGAVENTIWKRAARTAENAIRKNRRDLQRRDINTDIKIHSAEAEPAPSGAKLRSRHRRLFKVEKPGAE